MLMVRMNIIVMFFSENDLMWNKEESFLSNREETLGDICDKFEK